MGIWTDRIPQGLSHALLWSGPKGKLQNVGHQLCGNNCIDLQV